MQVVRTAAEVSRLVVGIEQAARLQGQTRPASRPFSALEGMRSVRASIDRFPALNDR
jgi:hypothetical protein